MSNTLLIADITSDVNLNASDRTMNDRVRLMHDAYNNPVWSNHQIADQKMARVQQPLLFQVCMVENISKPKLSQLDDLKVRINPKNQRIDRLSTSRQAPSGTKPASKNQLIVAVDVEADSSANLMQNSVEKSVFKLTLQDKSGAMYFAVNLCPLNFLKNDGSSCILGSKAVILPGAIFNRGMFLLQENTVTFMGGIIKSWNDGRDYKLVDYLESELERQGTTPLSRKRQVPMA